MNVLAPYDAIAIGGSAGALDVLNLLLPALPATFPVPVIIALHVAPGRPSLLAELFSARCALPALEASDKEPLLPGRIYFAPPSYHLLVERDRSCALSQDEPVHYSRPSIDVLFDSAAAVYRERLLAILLSGANCDGADGLLAIRQRGGDTWVQTPHSAAATAMPKCAIDRGAAAQVLSPDELRERLLRSFAATS